MSNRLKQKPVYKRMGSPAARLRKYAESIANQQELDEIMANTPPHIREHGFAIIKQYLKFKPREETIQEQG